MNVIIESARVLPGDAALVFGGEAYVTVEAETIPELLVALGIYATRSEARRAGRDGPIPGGYTELRASKKVPLLAIWNPTKGALTAEEAAWCDDMDRLYAWAVVGS